ncbi:hypothetical protein V8D89_016135 [Ganoderma adspersum]
MTPVLSDSVPEFTLVETMDGDEDGLVLFTVKCVFAPAETRIAYVAFTANHDVPDAAENKVSMWDHDNDAKDRAAYREAMDELSAVPRDALLWPASGIAIFTLSTVNGSVHLVPGMLKSMKDMETQWLPSLPSIDTISDHTLSAAIYDINDIVAVDLLDGGSRDAILAVLRGQPATRYVAFRIPTGAGYVYHYYGRLAEGILNEMSFLRTIPPHPHIISPPVGYISRVHNGKRVLCGYLLKYYPGGSLGQPERFGAPIATRIKWAYQVASGLHHLHHVAHTYHGDIKLDNVVLDENGDAVLIDLEQGRANEEHAAPELHAASLVSVGLDGRLYYSAPLPRKGGTGTNTEGVEEAEDETVRRLSGRDRPYDIWKDVPRDIEVAEVWAFATALQPLLSDVDTPSAILARCRSEDPNCRPTFGELEEFFRDVHRRHALPY